MSLTRKIAHNTAIQFIGKIAGSIIALITISIMLRYLGSAGFGQYSTMFNYLSVFGIVIDLGLYLIVTREIAKEGTDDNKLISNAMTFRATVGIIALTIAPALAILFPYAEITKQAIAVNAAAFLFLSLNQILTGVFQKHLRMEKVAIAEFVGRIIWLGLVVFAVNQDMGLLWIVGFQVLAGFIHFSILMGFARRYVKIRPAFDFPIWKKLWKPAMPIAFNIVFNLIYFKAGILTLTILKSEEEVGILGSAQKITENIITFAAIFAGLLFPLLSQYYKSNKEKFDQAVRKGFDAISILVAPMVVGTFITSTDLIVLFGGEEFEKAGSVLNILIVAAGVIFFGNLFGNIVVAIDAQKKLVPIYVVNAVIAVIISIVAIPSLSYYGAALSTMITEIIIASASVFIVLRITKTKLSLVVASKAVISSGVMAVALLLMHERMHILLEIGIAAIIYAATLFVIKGISKKEIQEIVSLRSNANS